MYFLFHDLEELYNRSSDGCDGNSVATLPDAQAIFVDGIHRNRSGPYPFQRAIRKSPSESNEKKQIEANWSDPLKLHRSERYNENSLTGVLGSFLLYALLN